jgi:protein gp37
VTTKTAIEWTEMTWNPTTGCDQVSPGCDHCYALSMAGRLKAMGAPAYQNDGDPRTSGPGFGLTLHPERLNDPLKWRDSRVVFVNSMSDLFHAKVPFEFVERVWATMEATPQHTYQILTKRPDRMARFSHRLPLLPNVWLGTSIEDQERVNRLVWLNNTSAAIRFVSAEPLLGPVAMNLEDMRVDWLIVGGESGPNPRPMDLDWARSLRDRCAQAGTSFFLKQLGGHPDKRGHEKAVLDGQRWTEMPPVGTASKKGQA